MSERSISGFLSRIMGRERTRSLDGASHARPLLEAGRIDNLNADIYRSLSTLRRRVSYLARNEGHIVAAVNVLVSNLVGPGIRPVSLHHSKVMRARLQDGWSRFAETADADGRTDVYGLQALMVRQLVECGESFARFRSRAPWDDLPVPLQVQVIHPELLPVDTTAIDLTGRIRCGIEFGSLGERVAYHFLPNRPSDPFLPITATWNPIRVPAGDVVHLFESVEPGQLRGVSLINAAVVPTIELTRFQAAALKRAQLSNMIVGAVTDATNGGAGIDAESAAMEPGTFVNLGEGKHIDFFDPKESAHYPEFVKAHLRSISAALGIPYELLSNDLSGVNYSSIRTGLLEFKKKLEYWQYSVIIPQLCRPLWNRYIKAAVLSGQIPAGQYAKKPEAFHAVEFLPPRMPWVDPVKDAQSAIAMIDARLTSRRMVIAELGYDVDQIDRDIAMDPPAPASKPAAPSDQHTDDEEAANV